MMQGYRLVGIASFIITCGLTQTSGAQNNDSGKPVGIEDLRSPGSPAFTLLDQAPAEIQRPSTPEAVRASFATATGKANGLIAPGYAVEVAPYWLKSHPNLTFDDYYNRDSFSDSLFRNVSVSLGSAALPQLADSDATGSSAGTRVALGLRTSTRFGWSDAAQAELDKSRKALQVALKIDTDRWGSEEVLRKLLVKLSELQTARATAAEKVSAAQANITAATTAEQAAKAKFASTDAAFTATPEDAALKQTRDAALIALSDARNARQSLEVGHTELQKEVDKLDRRLARYQTKRYELEKNLAAKPSNSDVLATKLTQATQELGGYLFELASAAAVNFEDDIASDAQVSDFAVWLTTGYESSGEDRVEVLLLGRYKWQDLPMDGDGAESYVDLGGRLAYNREQLTLFLEGIGRWNPGNDNISRTARLDGGACYRIGPGISITLVVGRGFKLITDEHAPLVATMGLDVGGGPTRSTIAKSSH